MQDFQILRFFNNFLQGFGEYVSIYFLLLPGCAFTQGGKQKKKKKKISAPGTDCTAVLLQSSFTKKGMMHLDSVLARIRSFVLRNSFH